MTCDEFVEAMRGLGVVYETSPGRAISGLPGVVPHFSGMVNNEHKTYVFYTTEDGIMPEAQAESICRHFQVSP